MTEQPANHPGINVSLGGLGEQQVTPRLEHAIKLGEGLLLLDQMMERLVTEQQVDAGVGHSEACAIVADQLHRHPLIDRFFATLFQAVRVGVHADQTFGHEGLVQITERLALTATGVEQHRMTWQRVAEQAPQIIDRHA
ncbi:hypothetical protein D3C84_773830 [compost metagenome]